MVFRASRYEVHALYTAVHVPSRSGLPGNCFWRFPSAAAPLAVTCGGSLMRRFPWQFHYSVP